MTGEYSKLSFSNKPFIVIEEPERNNFESFTGLVVYNAKQAKVSVPIGIGLVAIMLIFFVKVGKFKRKIKVWLCNIF